MPFFPNFADNNDPSHVSVDMERAVNRIQRYWNARHQSMRRLIESACAVRYRLPSAPSEMTWAYLDGILYPLRKYNGSAPDLWPVMIKRHYTTTDIYVWCNDEAQSGAMRGIVGVGNQILTDPQAGWPITAGVWDCWTIETLAQYLLSSEPETINLPEKIVAEITPRGRSEEQFVVSGIEYPVSEAIEQPDSLRVGGTDGSWSNDRFPKTTVNYSLVNMRGLPFYIPAGSELLEDWSEKLWNEYPETEFACVMIGYRPILQSVVKQFPLGVGLATVLFINNNVAFERGADIRWVAYPEQNDLVSRLLSNYRNTPVLGRWNYMKIYQNHFAELFALEHSVSVESIYRFLRGN